MSICQMMQILDGNSELLRTYKEKLALSEKKNQIYDCSRSNRMPSTDQTTEIITNARIFF